MSTRWTRVAALTTAQFVATAFVVAGLFFGWATVTLVWRHEWFAAVPCLLLTVYLLFMAYGMWRMRQDDV